MVTMMYFLRERENRGDARGRQASIFSARCMVAPRATDQMYRGQLSRSFTPPAMAIAISVSASARRGSRAFSR